MLEWFTEDSFFPACMGVLMAMFFVGMAFSSGETSMLRAGIGVAALTALLVVVEILIVTDREQVENSLYEMATALRENEFERVYAFLADEQLVARARSEIDGATCHACNITAVNKVEVAPDGTSATADFVAFAKASNKRFPSPVPLQRKIKLFFKRIDSQWKVSEFETSDPRAGISL